MRNGVNRISDGIFEINEKKKLFLNLKKKDSKILQYCNYILLKEKEKEFKKRIIENLQIFHKKLSFFPLTSKKINTERQFIYNDNNILNKRSFSNRQKNNKKISFSIFNNTKNLKLEKLRYNSANYKTIDKINNKSLKIKNSYNNKRLILIPLGLKIVIKNKEIEDKILERKKLNKKLIFKNNNPFYNNDNLFSPKRKEDNDMIFPKRFQKLKKELTEETLKNRDMFIKYEDLIINDK